MENNKNKLNKEDLIKGLKVVAGVGAITLVSVGIFKLGYQWHELKTKKAFELCFDTDPLFEEHLIKVMTEVTAKRLMEN